MDSYLSWEDAEISFAGCHCAKCGLAFVPGDSISRVRANGDIIHTVCWDDFAADNPTEFLDELR